MVAVTGVSGSGKSTLVKKILYPAILKNFDIYKEKSGEFKSLAGDLNLINQIEYIDQNPIGRSSRSNPLPMSKPMTKLDNFIQNNHLAKNRITNQSTFHLMLMEVDATNVKERG